jgi:hypothetical protein
MPITPPPNPPRPNRTYAGVVGFLVGFTVLLLVVCHYYLLPAIDAAKSATQPAQKYLAADAALLLAILLVILVSGLILTFRIGWFFFPRKSGPRTKTRYVDAWAEAGKRVRERDGE